MPPGPSCLVVSRHRASGQVGSGCGRRRRPAADVGGVAGRRLTLPYRPSACVDRVGQAGILSTHVPSEGHSSRLWSLTTSTSTCPGARRSMGRRRRRPRRQWRLTRPPARSLSEEMRRLPPRRAPAPRLWWRQLRAGARRRRASAPLQHPPGRRWVWGCVAPSTLTPRGADDRLWWGEGDRLWLDEGGRLWWGEGGRL